MALIGSPEPDDFCGYESGGAPSTYRFTERDGGYKSELKRKFKCNSMTLDNRIAT